MPHGVPDTLTALLVPMTDLRPYPANARTHDDTLLQESLRTNGQYRPVVVRREDGTILAGNGTYAAALALGWDQLAATYVSCTDEQARRIVLVDNRANDVAGYDDGLLLQLLEDLDADPGGLPGSGFADADLAELSARLHALDGGDAGDTPNLADRFLIPPFSVLDARAGWWRERKRAWLRLGIQSELGRDAELLQTGDAAALQQGTYQHKGAKGALPARETGGVIEQKLNPKSRSLAQGLEARRDHTGELVYVPMTGTSSVSVFDPVLCEVAYRWWCPPAGRVLDPYAGGSVRGIVASKLGLTYTGVDLRAEQVEANRAQGSHLLVHGQDPTPTWHAGDAGVVLPELLERGEQYDMVLTCPPYFGLERYSDDPLDLSTMDTTAFATAYGQHLQHVYDLLAPDSFAVIVVGSVRDSHGRMRDLRTFTVQLAQAAGFVLHNDAMLLTPVGSLPVRSARQFMATRVLGRTHQDVLVLLKGDRRRAAERCGAVDVADALAQVQADEDDPDPASATPTSHGYQPPTGYTPQLLVPQQADTTPVEAHGEVLVKRDDLYEAHGQRGGKVRACLALLTQPGVAGAVTAGSRHSPQVEIVAGLAQALDLPCAVHVPAGDDTPALQHAAATGAQVHRHRPGHNSVIVRRAKDDAAERGWLEVPFGMECQEAVDATASQVQSLLQLPTLPSRIVIPVGSGMSLAGVIQGLDQLQLPVPILGVVVGADPTRRLQRWAPRWAERATLVRSAWTYEQRPTVTSLGTLQLDPVYEAKTLPHLQPGDLLWCVGLRQHPASP